MTTMLRTLLLITLVACASSKNTPDAGTGDDAGVIIPDAFGGPSFGESCDTSSDCDAGGYCVNGTNDQGVCTYGCDQGCPEGYNCRATDVGGELVSLCMPQRFDFCKPCSEDVQCNGGVCVILDGEGFCLPDCPFEGTCPDGYTCNPDPTAEHSGMYCVPDTGSCTCTEEQRGDVRTCQTMNGVGTCYGLETCDPDAGGWGGCNAGTASTETCDGQDNDCDQLIDDGVSGSACPIQNGFGTCQGVALCTGASIVCQGQMPAAEKCNDIDDDCDGSDDELWPTLAQSCSPGIGACQRFGVIRCNAGQTDVECSVVAGMPAANESCNGLDDNCNGMTDETFTTLGQSCSDGVGACARQGNLVCATNGAGTQCSVTAGAPVAEACNGIDDNCNNVIDDGFKNGSGVYNQNNHCGSCATDCTVIYNLPNATGVCNAPSTVATCAMTCNAGAFNLDGATSNGCELVLDSTAIYVSKNDAAAVDNVGCGLGPVGTGAGNYPCASITYGLGRATTTGRANVRVANAIYNEAITLVAGKNLLGGHAPDNWQRNVSGTGTLITGVATIASTNHDYTVRATGITTATLFEGFVVIGAVNTKTSGNSYAIYVSSSTNALTIANNVVYGGKGGPGSGGGAGTAGLGGVDGVGRASNPAGYDAKVTTGTAPCDLANNRAFTNGGVRSCGADNVSGGNGGGNRCSPRPAYDAESSALDGLIGQLGDPTLGGAGGAGADAGNDGALVRIPLPPPPPGSYQEVCAVPAAADYGADGEIGRDASHGATGAGCSAAGGTVTSGHWVGSTGGAGGTGGNGGGGGGGGAGGGAKCAANGELGSGTLACSDGRDRLGGHGGGGGSGGCGGTGGTGATAGGGAFAIFIVGTTAPVVTGNSLNRGEGGQGGAGGQGGNGGIGGVGAAGGTSTVFCAGAAGRGGNGGDGGHGAGGGGGCGGGSFGIFTSGVGSPNYCMAAANNTFSGGSGGAGGAGGYSLINTGGAGATGALATCQFN